jgi:hypothetical protein
MIIKKYILRVRCFTVIVLGLALTIYISSCKKLVEAKVPTDRLIGKDVFSTDATAIGLLNGIYARMNSNGEPFEGSSSISLFTGLSSDEYTLYNGITDKSRLDFYQNTLSVANGSGSGYWGALYGYLFRCNDIIEGLESSNSKSLTSPVREQLIGEAKFLRAYFFFYLVNLYGDVPLCLSTDPEINSSLPRASKADVYKQIITDLTEAKIKLSDRFLDNFLVNTTTERVRPTRWAASALLARVYLYTSAFDKAEGEATFVISNTGLFASPLLPLNNAFLKNNTEAIWQLQPTEINFNTVEAQVLVIPSTGPNTTNFVYLSPNILVNFETGDQRAVNNNWLNSVTVATTTYRYPFKYKLSTLDPSISASTGTANMNEYFTVLRLPEQYLIRAEARAQLGNFSGAKTDLNVIRNRAGLSNTTASDGPSLLIAVVRERQSELFSEGHRWFDLKRMGKVDEVMTIVTPQKSPGGVWANYQQLYPIARKELETAPKLLQTPGY